MNRTHDAQLVSWVESARGHPEFPIQNLPLGVFRRRGSNRPSTVGVVIGDQVLDLTASAAALGVPAEPAASAKLCVPPYIGQLSQSRHPTWRTSHTNNDSPFP